MPRLALLALLALPACEPRSASNPPADAPGRPAPALVGPRLDGPAFDLAAERGKLVLVDFWASWCEPCRRELPALERLHRQHAAAGLVVVGVSVDEQRGDAEQFLRDQVQLSFPIVHDADHALAGAWSPPKMPTVYLVERDGTIARTFAGEKPGQLDELRAEVARRLAD